MNGPVSLESFVDGIADEALRVLESRRRPRGSTYRFQFNSGFKFRDATELVRYLSALGITHVYASPYLKAQPGSPHGYDVCNHQELNPELGTTEDYAQLVSTLKQHGIGQVLDVVPNHMAASSINPWWNDVLENGPNSPYSRFFDIDWTPVKDELANKVLLPLLGEQYGEVLESGQLQLEHSDGAFFIRYYDQLFPIGPKSAIPLLSHRIEELRQSLGESSEALLEFQSIITALEHLPEQTATSPEHIAERQREKEVVKRRLRRLETEFAPVAEHIQRNTVEFNGQAGDPASFDRLDQLLGKQAYRLSHWKAASDEVNYRRFFDVNGLAALCMEAEEVFVAAHRLVLELAARGDIDGFRIDHIDGLLDPKEYLWRLQWAYLAEIAHGFYSQQEAAGVLVALPVVQTAAAGNELQSNAAMPEPALAVAAGGGASESLALGTSLADLSAATLETEPGFPAWEQVRAKVISRLCQRLGLPGPQQEFTTLATPLTPPQGNGQGELATTSNYQHSARHGEPLPLYVVVEKILGPDEPVPDNWACEGTSGYDFLALLNGLFLEPMGVRDVLQIYARFTGERLEFREIVYRCKLTILRFAMASELQMLAHSLNRISEQHRRSRDFTLNMLRHGLREVLACFPVYRTYAGPGGVGERDKRFVNMAIAQAKRHSPAIDTALFDFIRRTLLLEHPEGLSDGAKRQREMFAGRFQQVTSPVMAKGVEDTAYYIYCPLISMNEVGTHPEAAVVPLEEFHRDNLDRHNKLPSSMIGTSTHDTKRSEDVRARIHVLAEAPHLWRKAINTWARLNRRFRREVDGLPAPSRNDEYLFYQTLVGVWPMHEPGAEEHGQLISRLQAYMEKATHEAKERTSWINPNATYDEAVREFVAGVLEPRGENRFLAEFKNFHESFLDCGLYNGLSQVVLKIMSPGVPDIYQGQEAWDFSLVDPDNRRRVDYASRHRWLEELQAADQAGPDSARDLARTLARSPRDPRLKLLATWRLLNLRRDEPALFDHGKYVPLEAKGAAARHICALGWQSDAADGGAKGAVVIAPRFFFQLTASAEGGVTRRLFEPEVWGDTALDLSSLPTGRWRNVFTGGEIELTSSAASQSVPVAEILADFPVAVLIAR